MSGLQIGIVGAGGAVRRTGARPTFRISRDWDTGADGIHSQVCSALFGAESPRFTGVVSFRAVVPTERVKDVPEIGAFTKWWGPTKCRAICRWSKPPGSSGLSTRRPRRRLVSLASAPRQRRKP